MSGTARALQDLSRGLRDMHAWSLLAWDDVRARYRSTLLGPLWITISHGMFIAGLAISFSVIFNQQLDRYLVYLAAGMTIWVLISSSLIEGPVIFLRARSMLFGFDMPASVHIFRTVLGQIITFAHNMLIYVIAIAFYNVTNVNTLLFIPGFAILVTCMVGWSTILSTLGTRYRDLMPAVSAVTQMLFLLTPIFWERASLNEHQWFALINPFYHLIEVVRQPLLGHTAEPLSWLIASGIAATLIGVAVVLYAWKRRNLSYWL